MDVATSSEAGFISEQRFSDTSGYGTGSSEAYSPKRVILRNYNDLRQQLQPDKCCDYMYQKGHLSDEDYLYIHSAETPHDKCDRFLQKLLVKTVTDKTYGDFDLCLSYCGQIHILDALEKSIVEDSGMYINDICPIDEEEKKAILRLLFLLKSEVLKGVDGLKLARRCLEQFAIDVETYINVYNSKNITEARNGLLKSILDMPKLLKNIPGFVHALKSDEDLNYDYVCWGIPLQSGKGFNQFKMIVQINDACTAAKLENGINNKHPEILYLFAKTMQAYCISAGRGSLFIEFKGLSEFTLKNNGRIFSAIDEFIGQLILTADHRCTSHDINVTLTCQVLQSSHRRHTLEPSPSGIIRRRREMLRKSLKKGKYAGFAWRYIDNIGEMIDLIVKNKKDDVFLSHVEHEDSPTFNRLISEDFHESSAPLIDLTRNRRILEQELDLRTYLCYKCQYIKDPLDLLSDNPSDTTCLQLIRDIEVTEDKSFLTRLKWIGEREELLGGFLINYESLVNYDKVEKLVASLDQIYFHKETPNDWTSMAVVDKRYTMIMLMDYVFSGEYELMAHLYDTLCNLQEFGLVDEIRESGIASCVNGPYDQASEEKLCYEGDLRVKIY